MSDVRIKCCGMFRPEDIQAVNAAMPDFCGFVVNVPASHRSVAPEQVLELRAELRGDIEAVGVFVDEDPAVMGRLVDDGGIDVVQLHGHEDAAYIEALRAALRNAEDKAIAQAFIVKDTSDIEAARESVADMVLLDAGLGSGTTFDWQLIRDFDRPYFLAGGLTPENVAEALDLTNAAYLDTSSGIETDGVKDPAKMQAFAEAVRAWDDEHPRLSFLEALHPEYHEEDEAEQEGDETKQLGDVSLN